MIISDADEPEEQEIECHSNREPSDTEKNSSSSLISQLDITRSSSAPCTSKQMTIDHSSTLRLSYESDKNLKRPADSKEQVKPKRKMEGNLKLDRYIIKTSEKEKQSFDKQLARYIYATNSSFRTVENPQFQKFVEMIRPGYKLPTRKQIGGTILNEVYDEEITKGRLQLKGQIVSMDLDGWSNIHNEPVVCVSVIDENSESFLVKTVDTSGQKHDVAYLTSIATNIIKEVSQEFDIRVRSFVTDNAANMKAMRKQLKNEFGYSIATYGCSSHIANLLAHDLDIPNVKSHVVQIIKYVRNTHLPAARYKEAGGKKLIMPVETRWNSVYESLESYLQNWPILASITLDEPITSKIMNMNIKSNAKDLANRLKPVSIALTNLQSDKCKISNAVNIWKILVHDLEQILPEKDVEKVKKRYDQAITDYHLLAYLLDPHFQKDIENMPEDEEGKAMSLAEEEFPEVIPIILKMKAKAYPFDKAYLFESKVMSHLTPCSWWRALKGKIDTNVIEDVCGLLNGVASSASVERIFSTFGLVHSKLRNRLGVEKAGKLVFLNKALNKDYNVDEAD